MRPIALVLAVTLGLTLVPLSPEAQQPGKVWRIGFLGAETASTNRHFRMRFVLACASAATLKGRASRSKNGGPKAEVSVFTI
jgi:hypothetical protein